MIRFDIAWGWFYIRIILRTSIKSRYLGLFTFVILLVCFRFCFVCFLGWICVPVKIETSWTEILALYPLIPPKKLKLWAKKLISSAKLRKCRELVNSREKYLILWHMLALILSEITSKLRYLEGNVTNRKNGGFVALVTVSARTNGPSTFDTSHTRTAL